VIDSDYRGEVKVLLFNLGDTDFSVNAGDRIAQLIIEKYTPTELVQVDELSATERGDGGFGSSGVGDQVLTTGKKRDALGQAASHQPDTETSADFLGLPSAVLLKNGDKNLGGTATTVGESVTTQSGKLIMIYLSMHDCPGCLEFTPLLVDLY